MTRRSVQLIGMIIIAAGFTAGCIAISKGHPPAPVVAAPAPVAAEAKPAPAPRTSLPYEISLIRVELTDEDGNTQLLPNVQRLKQVAKDGGVRRMVDGLSESYKTTVLLQATGSGSYSFLSRSPTNSSIPGVTPNANNEYKADVQLNFPKVDNEVKVAVSLDAGLHIEARPQPGENQDRKLTFVGLSFKSGDWTMSVTPESPVGILSHTRNIDGATSAFLLVFISYWE